LLATAKVPPASRRQALAHPQEFSDASWSVTPITATPKERASAATGGQEHRLSFIATCLVASDVRQKLSILRVWLSLFEPVTRGIGNVTCAYPLANAAQLRRARTPDQGPRKASDADEPTRGPTTTKGVR
jgi:hypothetical protein